MTLDQMLQLILQYHTEHLQDKLTKIEYLDFLLIHYFHVPDLITDKTPFQNINPYLTPLISCLMEFN